MANEIIFPKGSMSQRFIASVVGRHSFFIIAAFIIIAFVEHDFVVRDPAACNLWFIFFEVVSAYANVGLSLSTPGTTYSLCGNFTETSKFILILVMFLGKHRLLPRLKDPFIHFDYEEFQNSANAAIVKAERARAYSATKMDHGHVESDLLSPTERGLIKARRINTVADIKISDVDTHVLSSSLSGFSKLASTEDSTAALRV